MSMDALEQPLLHRYPLGAIAAYLRSRKPVALEDRHPGFEQSQKGKGRAKRRRRNGTVTLYIEPPVESPTEHPTEHLALPDQDDLSLATGNDPCQRLARSPISYSGWASPFFISELPSLTSFPVSLLCEHYLHSLAVPVRALDQGSPGLLYKKWFPMALTEPATIYAILLTSASHYLSMANNVVSLDDGMTPQTKAGGAADSMSGPAQNLLMLKQEALHQANLLLRDADPFRHTSDAALAAVAKLASYEAMYGDSCAFSAHMRGLSHMIALRGGLDCLNDSLDGLLRRMIFWIDFNAAFLLGTAPWFSEACGPNISPGDAMIFSPDMENFIGFR